MFRLKNLRYLVVPALLGAAIYGCNQSPPPAAPPQTQQLVAGVPSSPPFIVTGTKTAGDVPQYQSNGTVAWTGPELIVTDGGAATSLDELSDVAPILDGNSGDVIGWNGTVWDDLTIQAAIVAGLGNGTDNYVITSDGAGGVAWEAASGGSGLTIDGTIGDGQVPVYDGTDSVYVPVNAGGPVYNVKNFIGGRRAAGSDRQTTGSVTSSSTSMTVAAGWDGAEGHGIAVVGAGAAHGISAPSAPTVIPITTDWTVGDKDVSVTFTANTSTDRITTSEPLTIANGVGCILSNQGGALPTKATTTALTENTAGVHFLRNFPEVQTIAISGTPTGGTYRIYDADNKTGTNYVEVAYNANSATVQTALRTMSGWGSVTVAESGSTPNFTHTITMTGLPGNRAQLSTDYRKMTGGTPSIAHATTTAGGYKLYTSSANAISDTSALDIDGAGSGTHYISIVGTTSVQYDASALSGTGGWTDDGSDGSATTGNATLDNATKNRIFIDAVTNAQGYAIYGDSTTPANRYTFAVLNGTPNLKKIVADAAGYTSLEVGDLGKTLVQGTHDGYIYGFDNATRTIWVDPIVDGTDTFPGGSAVAWTITSGTGAGTQTAAATDAVYWDDAGATNLATSYRRCARRDSAPYRVGDWMLYPASSSGVWYVCVNIASASRTTNAYGYSASSAPGFDTDLGDTTQDGNVTWMRANRAVPTTLPSADVANALFTYVAAVSGTTVTLANAATTTVSSQIVLHDDGDAIQDWHDLMRASGGLGTLHFPKGRYPIVTAKYGTDTRLVDLGSSEYGYLCVSPASGTERLKCTLDLANAELWWQPLDSLGAASDSGSKGFFCAMAYSEPTYRGPGKFVYSPAGETSMEHWDAWNHVYFSGLDGGLTWDVSGPYVSNLSVFGFPRVTIHLHEPAMQQAEVWDNVHSTYGAAGHDAGYYLPGGWIHGGSLTGANLNDYSTGIYQDFNNNPQPLVIDGGFLGQFWRTDGLRVRQDHFTMSDSTLDRCTAVLVSENCLGVHFTNCYFNLTPITSSYASSVCQDFTIADCRLFDSPVALDAATGPSHIHDNWYWATPAPQNYSATVYAFSLTGTHCDFHDNQIFAQMMDGNVADVRCLNIAGSGVIDIHDNFVYSSGTWCGYRSAATGKVRLANNYFEDRTNQSAVWWHQSGNADWTSSKNVFCSSGNTSTLEIDACGRYESDGDTVRIDLASGVTGPVFLRNGNFRAGASTIAKSGTTITGCDFSTEPTLSGTLLNTSNNSILGNKTKAVTLAASQNNYTWPTVCDTILVDANAAYSITGIVPRAKGTIVKIVNVDSSDVLTIAHGSASSTAANRININVGSDLALGSLDGKELICTENATMGWSEN